MRAGPLAAAAGETDVGVVDGLRRSAGGQEREFGRPARPYAASTNAERGSVPAMRLPPGFAAGLEICASVAVDGVCLTVTSHPEPDAAAFDVMQQSLALTTLAGLAVGSRVNVERAAKDGAEIGGRRSAPGAVRQGVSSAIQDEAGLVVGGVGVRNREAVPRSPALARGCGAEMRSRPGP